MRNVLIHLNRSLCRSAGGVITILFSQSALADFVGVQAEIRTDLPICQDTGQDYIDEPLDVCSLYVVFDDPTDRFLSISDADITTSDPDGFYQHPFNFTPNSPACETIPAYPDLVCDSFITIGLECGPPPPAYDGTVPLGDFDYNEFNNNGHVIGGWFNADPFNGQGDANSYPDMRVLVGQFSMAEGDNTFGEVGLHFRTNGIPITVPNKMFDCRAGACLGSACPADVDRDGAVGAFDLATLLGAWGPCDNGPCRCVDSNYDGQIGAADLAQLLGNWGACP